MTESFGLTARTGDGPVLTALHAEGRIDGLLLQMQLTQHYRNDGHNAIEAVYTFPLAWGATLLGLSVQLGEQRLEGRVVAREQASEDYEQAIVAGDTPVLVEDTGNGLYTAQLGNLLPGEAAVLTLRYAQPLSLVFGRLRIVLPTTVASRYGDEHAHGGLPAHASVLSSTEAVYPFTVQVDVAGTLASAILHSPSHPIAVQAVDGLQRALLKRQAWLDRDFVLVLEDLPTTTFAVAAQGNDGSFGVMASFCPPQVAATPMAPVKLKLLVDCSGSMAGDRMLQARHALAQVASQLQAEDLVSYARFGSQLVQDIAPLSCCDADTQRRLAEAIYGTDATLGGTELHEAIKGLVTPLRDCRHDRDHGQGLEAIHLTEGEDFSHDVADAFARTSGPADTEADGAADVFLITDGDVWEIEPLLDLVRKAGHRIFAIGVGSAPSESLLRQLAEHSGGACELVNPNEDMTEAVLRMFHRLRGRRANAIEVRWPGTPSWTGAAPGRVYPGETVHMYARYDSAPSGAPILTWQAEHMNGDQDHSSAVTSPVPLMHNLTGSLSFAHDDTLSRLTGAAQLRSSQNGTVRLDLALRHQLVCAEASLLLVHERAQADKADGMPELHTVAHMQAAGASGFGSVLSLDMIGSTRSRAHVPGQMASVPHRSFNQDSPNFLRKTPTTLPNEAGTAIFSSSVCFYTGGMAADTSWKRPFEAVTPPPVFDEPEGQAELRQLLAMASDSAEYFSDTADFHRKVRALPWPRDAQRLLRWLEGQTGHALEALLRLLQVLQHQLEPGVALPDSPYCSAQLVALIGALPVLEGAMLAEITRRGALLLARACARSEII